MQIGTAKGNAPRISARPGQREAVIMILPGDSIARSYLNLNRAHTRTPCGPGT